MTIYSFFVIANGVHLARRVTLCLLSRAAPLKRVFRRRKWRRFVIHVPARLSDAIKYVLEPDAGASLAAPIATSRNLPDAKTVQVYRLSWRVKPTNFWITDQEADACLDGMREDYWADHADIKKIWKLSCGHFLIPALKTRQSSNENEVAACVFATILDWIKHNDRECGVNWASPMAVSLRLANWSLLLLVLRNTACRLPEENQSIILESLQRHMMFVIEHLEADGLRTNHYVANISSLFIASLVFSGCHESEQINLLARRLLEKELLVQTDKQGVHFEYSLHYHRLVLELFAYPHFLCLALGLKSFSPRYIGRLNDMLNVLERSVNRAGFLPQIGDNDSEFLWCAILDHLPPRNMLPFIGICRQFLEGTNSTDSAWGSIMALTGFQSADKFESTKPSLEIHDDGWHVLRSPGWYIRKTRSMDLFAVCGPIGSRGLGAHDHLHQNQLLISCNGQEIIVDPGTGCYTANRNLRHTLRMSEYHSTVDLGAPSYSGERVEDLFRLREVMHSRASIDRQGVLHMQTFRLNRLHTRNVMVLDDFIRIHDRIADRNKMCIRWVLHPETQVKLEGDHIATLRRGSTTALRLVWSHGAGSIRTQPYSDYFSDIRETRALCIDVNEPCYTEITPI
ncbi:MAG: heparinase II/III domain-containing protein [Kiritimatiellia bacterium]